MRSKSSDQTWTQSSDSQYEISKQFRYSGAKKLCAKLKSDRNCSRSPGSGRKRKTSDRSDCFIIKHFKSGTPTKKQLQTTVYLINYRLRMGSKFHPKLYSDA